MKEFDEDSAVRAMAAAAALSAPDDDVYDLGCEVLDLIFDYYEDNDGLDFDNDDDDDPAAITDYVISHLDSPIPCGADSNAIARMVQAELDYEQSLL